MLTTGPIFPRSSSPNLQEAKYNQKIPVVTWLSPRENDTFGSWDILTAKWNSQEVLDSPAFRLCTPLDDSLQVPLRSCHNETGEACLDDNCGSKISPSVEESDGSFLINFTVPDIAGDAFFVLQMNDASGAVLSSPIFKLSSHPVHIGVRTRMSQPNFTLDTTTTRQPLLVVGFTILLIIVCILLMAPPLLWLYRRHGKKVKMYFRRLRVSQTSTPALLQKIDPGDGTSVPIPVFMPSQTFRAPSQSMRPLFLSESFDRASGDQPPHAGSWRSFRLSNRYSGGSIYPSLPPIPTSSNAFIDEGDTVMANLSRNYISGLPLPPPGLMSTPPRVLLRPSV